MNQQYESLRHYIQTRADQKGLSTVELSETLGFGRFYVNAVMNGQFLPSQERCRQIAQFLGDDPNIILGLVGGYEPSDTDGPTVRPKTPIIRVEFPDRDGIEIIAPASVASMTPDEICGVIADSFGSR
jgi:cyanate lyase